MTVPELRYDADGLVPVVTQDAGTGEVLMLAWADREAVEATVRTSDAHYHSRSRARLWRKGATSGHVQRVVEVRYDCDADALLYRVEQTGPACHTGHRSCFYRAFDGGGSDVGRPGRGPGADDGATVDAHAAGSGTPLRETAEADTADADTPDPDAAHPDAAHPDTADPDTPDPDTADPDTADPGEILTLLESVVAQRLRDLPEGSYVRRMHERGLGYVAQKVIEEAGESAVAALEHKDDELLGEAADLLFHLTVLLRERGVGLDRVAAVLARRHRSTPPRG